MSAGALRGERVYTTGGKFQGWAGETGDQSPQIATFCLFKRSILNIFIANI